MMQGVLYCAHFFNFILFIVLILSLRSWEKEHSDHSPMAVFLMAAAVFVPAAVCLLHCLHLLPFFVVPFSITAAELCLIGVTAVSRLRDLRNEAKNYSFQHLEDALVLLDANGLYNDSNQRMRQIFPEICSASRGSDPASSLPFIRQILLSDDPVDVTRNDRIYEGKKRIIDMNSISGFVIWFSDVTLARGHETLLNTYQKTLETQVRSKSDTIRDLQIQMIINFANIVESRDLTTGGHIKRTSQYVRMLIQALIEHDTCPELRDPEFAEHICLSAPLHDIGKISIPDSILNKETAYTPEEFEIMKSHTWLGGQILDKTMSGLDDQAYYWLARNMAVYHHEKWDGSGYPKGLKGSDIPLCARIMAVADVFDALTSTRPYKGAVTFDQAMDMIRAESGKHFDPNIVEVFVGLREQLRHRRLFIS